MEFKKFYADFGKIFPIGVAKMACDYHAQGYDVASALNKAIASYAAEKRKRPLRYEGYTLNNSRVGLSVYKLQAETESGLRWLSPYTWDDYRDLTITKNGENCLCLSVAEFKNQPESVLGGYAHNNRYAAVVRLNYGNVILLWAAYEQLREYANLLAKNALAWYPAYLIAKRQETFSAFLLEKPIRFAEFINETMERTPTLIGKVTIGKYLENLHQTTNLNLQISDVRVFGF